MAPDLAWRRAFDSSDIAGLSSRELHGMAALWKRTRRELTVSFGGRSMLPTIAPGAKLRMVCTDDVVPGDVVVFVYLDQVVVHRLVARSRSWWLTCGDAATIPDPPLADSAAIIGKIIAICTQDGEAPVPPAPARTSRAIALFATRCAGFLAVGGARAVVRFMRMLAYWRANWR